MTKVGRHTSRWFRLGLQRVYGFDSWHVGHAGEAYACDIVRVLNAWPASMRQSVVEVGCGLGDILRHLSFTERVGLDHDRGALAAARFLARLGWGVVPRFEQFRFPEDPLSGVYNAIIMVNWIHQVDPSVLGAAIRSYGSFNLRRGGALVLDTVADPAYAHNHDVRALAWTGASIEMIGEYARGRRVWVLR